MSLTENVTTPATLTECLQGPTWAFEATKDDDAYFEDPLITNRPLVACAISVDIDTEDIKVEFQNKQVSVIPAGALIAGKRYPLNIVKLFDTGTGAAVRVTVWMGQTLQAFRPDTY